jgi:hypothetical protein
LVGFVEVWLLVALERWERLLHWWLVACGFDDGGGEKNLRNVDVVAVDDDEVVVLMVKKFHDI